MGRSLTPHRSVHTNICLMMPLCASLGSKWHLKLIAGYIHDSSSGCMHPEARERAGHKVVYGQLNIFSVVSTSTYGQGGEGGVNNAAIFVITKNKELFGYCKIHRKGNCRKHHTQ